MSDRDPANRIVFVLFFYTCAAAVTVMAGACWAVESLTTLATWRWRK